jgi:MFS family permease
MAAVTTTLDDRALVGSASDAKMSVRALTSSAAGNALEWFDFVLYGALSATVLPTLFFPSLDPTAATLASFAAVGVGFIARPLGAIVFGRLGDRIGRKQVLLMTVILMGLSSLLVGLLPTYQTIGIAAPICLVILRILQGFALGGESTGSQLMAIEYAPDSKRGLYGGLVNMGSPISQTLANGLLLLLNFTMSQEQFLSYGWRIPFILSVVLIAIGVYVRLRLAETPAFRLIATGVQKQMPLGQVFRLYWPTVLRLIFIWLGPSACIYVVYIFSLNYMIRTLGFPSQTAFTIMAAGNFFGIFCVIAGGAISDRIGRRATMLAAFVAAIIITLSYFTLLDTKNIAIVSITVAALLGSTYVHFGVQPTYFGEPFPTAARFLGSAMSLSLANMITGGNMPLIAVYLVSLGGGSTQLLTGFLVVLLVIGMAITWMSSETRNVAIARGATD